tara:strand:- start:1107 stop:1562 length:456 start_codon:yes stop_codon:yes gene_type:complete
MVPLNNALIPQDACACIIITQSEKFVMQLRDNLDDIFFPGRWGFFGGAVEPDETPKDTIVREIFEELSIKFSANRFQSCGQILLETKQLKLIRKFYILNISPFEIHSIRLTEGQCWKEFSKNEVKNLNLTPYDEYFFHMICNQIIPSPQTM